jgi:hypothetical protein
LLLKETSRPTFKESFSYILPEIKVIPERIFKMYREKPELIIKLNV